MSKELECVIGKIRDNKIRNIIDNSIRENHVEGGALRYLMINEEAKDIFVSLCSELNQKEDIWNIATKDYWLLQICYWSEKQQDVAGSIIKKYVGIHGKEDIHYYLLAARVAQENGIVNDNIKKANRILEILEKNKNLFRELITGKTIAIVGNGPSEVELGKGSDIDAHDYVIRFNNYQTKGYEEDYGSRTDIWIRGFGGDDVEDRSKDNSYKFIGWTGDYKYIKIFGEKNFEILYRDCCIKRRACAFIDTDLYYKTIVKCGERLPTTGCSTIYTIYKYKQEEENRLSVNDIYGFSFFQDKIDVASHYFIDRDEKEDQVRSKNHNLNAESMFLNSLFYQKKEADNVKIAVCYHKPFNLLKNDIFVPIHVGRDCMSPTKDGTIRNEDTKWLTKNLIGDNTGDNISRLNRNYCELTGLYWMWKNQRELINPEYLGLMHYRRVFEFDDFSNERYMPDVQNIKAVCENYDFIVSNELPAFSAKINKNAENIHSHFEIEHGKQYTDIFIKVLYEKCGDKKRAIDRVLFKRKQICWYNIMLAKKNAFDEYCEWLFGVLDELNKECIKQDIDVENSRMMGFYGEILLAIYVEWLTAYQRKYKIGRLPVRKIDEVHLYNYPYIPADASLLKRMEGKIKAKDTDLKYKNIGILMKFLISKKHKEKVSFVNQVHSLTYRDYAPAGGAGGGGAVLSCQKSVLGDSFGSILFKYSFKESNYYLDYTNPLWDLWSAALFGMKKAEGEKNTVYITHDYGTAFGLAIAGKKYVLVSHIQGSRVEEKTNFGEKFSEIDAKIIRYCEKIAFKSAEYVCFPSKGAQLHFENSSYKKKYKYEKGPVLYNTLYAYPDEQPIDKIPMDNNYETYLSIGQLTVAKGIDRCVDFFEKMLAKNPDKWVRWIIVGEGILKQEIIEKCVQLRVKYKHFRFSHMSKCSYRQIQYLQRICDVYIMLQRISIFDLSTLEAMAKSKAIILSPNGGNLEFNQENNIIFYEDNFEELEAKLRIRGVKEMGKINRKVYDKYFSNVNFAQNYHYVIEKMVEGKSKKTKELDWKLFIKQENHKAKVDIEYAMKEG